MASARDPCPDWRDPAGYIPLLGAEPAALAWEWLRRDPRYRAAAQATAQTIVPRARSGPFAARPAEPAARPWGLHAFEDPALGAAAARPVWRREAFARVLDVRAAAAGPAEDRFDLARFAAIAAVVRGRQGEHVLLSDGHASVRLDVRAGSLLAGPVRLEYRLAGLAGLHAPLETLAALLRLSRSGRLAPPAPRGRNRRLVVLLRAADGLREGARQRDLAAALLSAEAAGTRWRSEAPSLRAQAQRLAKGARAMAGGGWRALLTA